MTDKQKLEVAAAKARKELRALAMDEDATAEQITEATARLDNLEARAAALPDPDPDPAKDGDGEGERDGEGADGAGDAEAREIRKLADKSTVARYVGAALEGANVDGAEAEYNAALGMSAGSFPLRLLAPEARATTGRRRRRESRDRGLIGCSVTRWARWLGIFHASVPAGTAAYSGDDGGRFRCAQARTGPQAAAGRRLDCWRGRS